MCYTRRKILGCVAALWESDDTSFSKPNGQSRNLNVYVEYNAVDFVFSGVASETLMRG